MTAKRFTYEYDEYNGNLFDNKMNTFYHIEDSDENIEVLCDRLNWLVEENEQLRHDATILIQSNQDYRKENEQLKQQLKELKEDVPLLLAFYRWYPFAVEKKEHQAYNRLWDFVND